MYLIHSTIHQPAVMCAGVNEVGNDKLAVFILYMSSKDLIQHYIRINSNLEISLAADDRHFRATSHKDVNVRQGVEV